jgi:hypothetical protein
MTSRPKLTSSRILPGCFVASLVLSVFLLSACATVQPWERGRLAQPQMALEADALLGAMDQHVYSSKEAASGGVGPAGGGCGCN